MMSCIFCRIVKGEVPSKRLYEDEDVLAFADISPQAPTHVLVVPKRHIANIADITPGDAELIGKLFLIGNQMARDGGIAERGYRLVINSGPDGGQAVDHIHLHVLGGRRMTWPPG
jgi:histidine triad (HIT) family protein